MSIKRTLMFAVGLCLASAAFTGVAAAGVPDCYPNCATALGIDDPTAVPGQLLTVTATDLDPGSSASAVVNSDPINLGSKTVDSTGKVSFSFTVPSDFTGQHSVSVTGLRGGAPITLVTTFTVAGSGTGGTGTGGSPLPRTGDDSSLPLTQVGIALLAVGGGAVYIARRRQTATAA